MAHALKTWDTMTSLACGLIGSNKLRSNPSVKPVTPSSDTESDARRLVSKEKPKQKQKQNKKQKHAPSLKSKVVKLKHRLKNKNSKDSRRSSACSSTLLLIEENAKKQEESFEQGMRVPEISRPVEESQHGHASSGSTTDLYDTAAQGTSPQSPAEISIHEGQADFPPGERPPDHAVYQRQPTGLEHQASSTSEELQDQNASCSCYSAHTSQFTSQNRILEINKIKGLEGYWYSASNDYWFKEVELPKRVFKKSLNTSESTLTVTLWDGIVWRSCDGRAFKFLPFPPGQIGNADRTTLARDDYMPSHVESYAEHNGRGQNVKPLTQDAGPQACTDASMNSNLSQPTSNFNEPPSTQPDSTSTSAALPPPRTARDEQPINNVYTGDHEIMTRELSCIPVPANFDQLKTFELYTNLKFLDDQGSGTPVKPVPATQELKDITATSTTTEKEPSLPTQPHELLSGTNVSLTTGLIDQLERNESLASAKPPYTQLIQEIAKLLFRHDDIVAPLYFPSPSDDNQLLVLGPGVCKEENNIKELEKRFPPWCIKVSELEPCFRTERNNLPVYTEAFAPGSSCSIRRTYHTPRGHHSVVGGYLKDSQDNHGNTVFAATAGHAFLTENEKRQLSDVDGEDATGIQTRAIRNDIFRRIRTDDEKYWIAPHNARPVRIEDEVFVAYTHFIPATIGLEFQTDQLFCCDICLVQAEATQLDPSIASDLVHFSPLFSSSFDSGSVATKKQSGRTIRISGYVLIKDESDINKLRKANVNLIVDGKQGGRLVERPTTFELNDEECSFTPTPLPITGNENRKIIAPHIAFTVDHGGLIPGKSGSAILVYNKKLDVYHILGLLMGSFKGASELEDKEVYQAMPFGPAIQNLKLLYGDRLANLTPVVGEESGVDLVSVLPSLA